MVGFILQINSCSSGFYVNQFTYRDHYLRLGLLQITNAANAPGTQPARVNSVTIKIEPHPLSSTARGGNRIHTMALAQLIILSFNPFRFYCTTAKRLYHLA